MSTVIGDLTEDDLFGVFERLGPSELEHCGGVCVQWRRLSRQERLWRRIVQEEPLVVPRDCRGNPWDVYTLHKRWARGAFRKVAVDCGGLSPSCFSLDGDVVHVLQARNPTLCRSSVAHGAERVVPLSDWHPGQYAVSADGYSVFSWKEQLEGSPAGQMDCVQCFFPDGRGAELYTDELLKRDNIQAISMGLEGRIAFGLRAGSLCIVPRLGSNVAKVDFTRQGEPPVWSVDAKSDGVCVAGSALGDVATIDWDTLTVVRRLIGPCNCAIPAVAAVNDKIVLGGYAHTQLGNGHRSNVVAWDVRSGSRIGSFGRETRGSASAQPHVRSICGDAADGRRIAVAYRDRITIFETRMWTCLLEPEVPDTFEVSSIAMNAERLVIGLNQKGTDYFRLEALNFS